MQTRESNHFSSNEMEFNKSVFVKSCVISFGDIITIIIMGIYNTPYLSSV